MFPCGDCDACISLFREFSDVAPQKPLRADEPVTQNDELGPRGVMASNPAGAAGIETRVRFLGWPGCLPRRLQLVFTRSSGRNSLCLVGSKRCGCHRGRTPSDSMFGSSVTGLGANPSVGGVGRVPQRDSEVKPQKTVSQVAVVVDALVRRTAPQAGPKVRHGRS